MKQKNNILQYVKNTENKPIKMYIGDKICIISIDKNSKNK